MNQSEFEANTHNWHQVRENACDKDAIGFSLASFWLKKWREPCQPIKECSKANQSKHKITLDTQVKTALHTCVVFFIGKILLLIVCKEACNQGT